MDTPAEKTLPGGHPRGLAVLFLTEMAERLSFYTVKNQLVLYLVTSVLVSEAADKRDAFASEIYGRWGAFLWATPFLGGIIADRYLGTKRAVMWGGLVFFLGHLMLGASDLFPAHGLTVETVWSSPHFLMFAFGLFVVACGNGLFKGNISVLVGTLYDRDDRRSLRDRAFQIFYLGINLGSALAPFTAPWILRHVAEQYKWGASFGSAAVAIAISFTVFFAGRHLLVDRQPTHLRPKDQPMPMTPQQKSQTVAVCVVLVMSALFWSVYFQDGLALTLFAQDHIDLKAWGWDVQQFLSINPIGIICLTPVFVIMWQFLQRRRAEPSTLGKMAIGLTTLGCAMLIMMYASTLVPTADKGRVSPWFLALAFGLQTVSELCLSPMGLSFVTQYAPPGRAGLFMGMWFLSLAVGNYATGRLNQLGLGLVPFYGLLAGMMLVAAAVLFLMLRKLRSVLGA